MENKIDCVIIGAGISGITAAIYLKRWNFNLLLLEKNMPGGIVNNTSVIENYPGFTRIDGSTFALKLYNQIKELNIPYKYSNVKKIIKTDNDFIIETDVDKIICSTIILATGREAKTLGIDNEKELIGKGVSYCATCDGPLYKNKKVCIVGGGNSALEESLYLANICEEVTIINRSNQLRADNYLYQQVKSKNNINILYNAEVIALEAKNDKLNNITIKQSDKKISKHCDGLFIYIGFIPNFPFIENLECDNGYIIVNQRMETNISNLCACGDIIKKDLYQIITAASEGALAANTIKNILKS